jgi:hypothetical protein
VFLRFSHAKSSPKRSPVCVLARAVGSGVSVNARQSPVAKSETFRPLPGGNGASEVVVKWTDRLPRPELWGSCRTSFSISVRVRPVYSRGSPYTLCYTSSAGKKTTKSNTQKWGNGFLSISRQRSGRSSPNFVEVSRALARCEKRRKLPKTFHFRSLRKLTI